MDDKRDTFYENLISGMLGEQRRNRVWGYVFKFCFLLYLFFTSISFMFLTGVGNTDVQDKAHIGVVDLLGPIDRSTSINSTTTVKALNSAFEAENSIAIILNADSPGGSPVQSDIINREINRLKNEYPDKPVIAVVGDMCASGCYYIISAADKILVNPTSLLGSIGVKMSGFGYTDIMNKVGVERRTISVGDHKTMMDPFSPEDEVATDHLKQRVLIKTHEEFVRVVTEGRGTKIDSSTNTELFNGLVWAGREAIEIGLADAIGSLHDVAREYTDGEGIHNYTIQRRSIKDLFFGSAVELAKEIATPATHPKLRMEL